MSEIININRQELAEHFLKRINQCKVEALDISVNMLTEAISKLGYEVTLCPLCGKSTVSNEEKKLCWKCMMEEI
jgi:predicted amidophosphoribosyltransferase